MKRFFHRGDLSTACLETIIATLCVIAGFLAISDLVSDVARAQGPKVEVNSLPAPVEMTQTEYNETVLHRDALITKRNAELTAANQALVKQLNDLQTAGNAANAIVAVGPDLSKEIGALNSDLAAEKRHATWNLWKGALLAFPLGIAAAIAGYLLTKGTVFAAKIAAVV